MKGLLNQNPLGNWCVRCGDLADEFYNDEWLCEDCIVEMDEDL
jgi:NMD protein affecting ribosome stability and mRNA decay